MSSNDQIVIELNKRDVLGKKVKQLRKTGIIPAVIHNHGQESIIVQGDFKTINNAYWKAGKHHPIIVKIGSQEFTTLIKDVFFDHRHQDISHVVFNAVRADQEVEAEVPIKPRFDEGNEASPAERAGLMILNQIEKITIQALPENIPDVLYYDAERLVKVGDHLKASDLILPEGVKLPEDHQDVQLVAVFEPSAVAAANDQAGGSEEVENEEEEEASDNPKVESKED